MLPGYFPQQVCYETLVISIEYVLTEIKVGKGGEGLCLDIKINMGSVELRLLAEIYHFKALCLNMGSCALVQRMHPENVSACESMNKSISSKLFHKIKVFQ